MALRQTTEGSTIYIIPAPDGDSTGPTPCQSTKFYLRHSISIEGEMAPKGRTNLGCQGSSGMPTTISITNSALPEQNASISISNLRLENIDLWLHGFSVRLSNITMENSLVKVLSGRYLSLSASLHGLHSVGDTKCNMDEKCTPTGLFVVHGNFSSAEIMNSFFAQTSVVLEFGCASKVRVHNSTFTNDLVNSRPVTSGLLIWAWDWAPVNVIKITHCLFTNQFYISPADTAINLFYAALLVRWRNYPHLPPKPYSFPTDDANNDTEEEENTLLYISHSQFVDNERGLTLQGSFSKVFIDSCYFGNNIALHAGAGILHLTRNNTLIQNTTFENNAAGKMMVRPDLIQRTGEVQIVGDELRVSSHYNRGSMAVQGKGGAIRVQYGRLTVKECFFRNNSARISGGAIYVDRVSSCEIIKTEFHNPSEDKFFAKQGDILDSSGRVVLKGATFRVQATKPRTTIFQHSGDLWSVEAYDVSVICPVGHRLIINNATTYRVVDMIGLQASHKMDQLMYSCDSCPRHKYSTDNGFLLHQRGSVQEFYFTLMINTKDPVTGFASEQFELHDITCLNCPYGATCEDAIRSLPNFWGYRVEKNLTFQHCPKGYCCSRPQECVNYNTCADQREGRLCSRCSAGYSEALFSPKCVPNQSCGPLWLWPFSCSTGLLYVLILLYQKDIRGFIFTASENTRIKATFCRCLLRRRRHIQSRPNGSATGSPPGLVLRLVPGDNAGNATGAAESEPSPKAATVEVQQGSNIMDGSTPVTETPDSGTEPAISEVTPLSEATVNHLDSELAPLSTLCPTESNGGANTTQAVKTDIGAVLLIIILYYFQDAMLFSVNIPSDAPTSKHWASIRLFMLGLFRFQIEVAHFVDNVCLMVGMRPTQKILALAILVPYVLLLFCLIYACYAFYRMVTRRNIQAAEEDAGTPAITFISQLSTGFMLALLFTYQKLAQTAFTLLNCVPVANESVLFIQGDVNCYTDWQYGVLTYALVCIIPFSMVLMLAPGLMKEGRLSAPVFVCACLCPFPFVAKWIAWRLFRNCKKRHRHEETAVTPGEAETAIVRVLQGPYRDINVGYLGPVCWAGIILFRRLVLVLLSTFINHSLIRVVSMLLLCFLILLNHVYVQPYKDYRVNLAGTLSISALMLIGGINLIRAGFEVAEYMPHGPNEELIYTMRVSEDVLMFWVPLIVLAIILVLLLLRIAALITNKFVLQK